MYIAVKIKSGTGGYSDYDGIDYPVAKIECNNQEAIIPRIGETLTLNGLHGPSDTEYHDYLVRDVRYLYDRAEDKHVYVDVYVVPIGELNLPN